MPKKIFNLTDKQDTWIQKEAKRLSTTEVEVLRRVLDGRMPHEAAAERAPEDLKAPVYEEFFVAKWSFDACETITDLISRVDSVREYLLAYRKDGVVLARPVEDGLTEFLTDDKAVAKKHKFHKQQGEE